MAPLSWGSLPTTPPFPFHYLRRSSKPISIVRFSSPMASYTDPPHPPHPLPPHSSLEVSGGGKDLFLPARKTIHHPYYAYPLVASNRHVETIFASFYRSKPDVKYKREVLRTKDDGSVSLDWVSGDEIK